MYDMKRLFLHCLANRRDYQSFNLLGDKLKELVQAYHQHIILSYKANKAKGSLASDAWPAVSSEQGLTFLGLSMDQLKYLQHTDIYLQAISALHYKWKSSQPVCK
jgi:hypothetical protein